MTVDTLLWWWHRLQRIDRAIARAQRRR